MSFKTGHSSPSGVRAVHLILNTRNVIISSLCRNNDAILGQNLYSSRKYKRTIVFHIKYGFPNMLSKALVMA